MNVFYPAVHDNIINISGMFHLMIVNTGDTEVIAILWKFAYFHHKC